jgi:hypothetical protein
VTTARWAITSSRSQNYFPLPLILTSNSIYGDEAFSDVTILIQGFKKVITQGWGCRRIHVQRHLLEAHSGWFRRELRLPKYAVRHHVERFILLRLLTFVQTIASPVVEMDHHFSPDQNQVVVAYLYGFDITENKYDIDCAVPTTIDDFLIICLVTEHYEIRGLRNAAVTAAGDALARALSDGNGEVDECALETFLGYNWHKMLEDKRRIPHFLNIILGGNFTKLYLHEFLQETLKYAPKVVRCLLVELVKEKTPEGPLDEENTLEDPLSEIDTLEHPLDDSDSDEEPDAAGSDGSLLDELVTVKTLKDVLDKKPKLALLLLDQVVKEEAGIL